MTLLFTLIVGCTAKVEDTGDDCWYCVDSEAEADDSSSSNDTGKGGKDDTGKGGGGKDDTGEGYPAQNGWVGAISTADGSGTYDYEFYDPDKGTYCFLSYAVAATTLESCAECEIAYAMPLGVETEGKENGGCADGTGLTGKSFYFGGQGDTLYGSEDGKTWAAMEGESNIKESVWYFSWSY